jgi:predicted Rossmann fold nucleotide-binding protein DprA/Smf involved in DNA uptake
VPEALAVTSRPSESLALHWLALSLTEGLGPKRGRSLIERLGGVQNVFRASLTELEATDIQTVSAQALGTGLLMELADDEMGRIAAAAGCHLPGRFLYQRNQSRSTTAAGPLCAEMWTRLLSPGIAVVGTRHPTPQTRDGGTV